MLFLPRWLLFLPVVLPVVPVDALLLRHDSTRERSIEGRPERASRSDDLLPCSCNCCFVEANGCVPFYYGNGHNIMSGGTSDVTGCKPILGNFADAAQCVHEGIERNETEMEEWQIQKQNGNVSMQEHYGTSVPGTAIDKTKFCGTLCEPQDLTLVHHAGNHQGKGGECIPLTPPTLEKLDVDNPYSGVHTNGINPLNPVNCKQFDQSLFGVSVKGVNALAEGNNAVTSDIDTCVTAHFLRNPPPDNVKFSTVGCH